MTEEVRSVRRTDSVRVKLAPEMMDRVEKLSSDYCMPPATLCAFAVGAWVRQQEASASVARMTALEVARKATGVLPDEEALQKMVQLALQLGMAK